LSRKKGTGIGRVERKQGSEETEGLSVGEQ